jgi:hypothetical protein
MVVFTARGKNVKCTEEPNISEVANTKPDNYGNI